ncbi:hypothetical protein H8M03_04750 [Sphingomonas sabuli]|uniref:Uncharacterized protein n=1 Tax=Sphingomonas sabuli TaxID=2764186 RepID=A0A7G9L4T9_9SPHN|nr:hypothetical protein [Sphingomonas sabuli]QNM83638.1 hypothetical protein H8M03_04750 [Sphingomonas sabuli]
MQSTRLFRFTAAAFALAFSTTSVATVLVVRAAGPSSKVYPPGKALPESAKIELRSGDSVMLLNTNGARTIRGPGTFAVATNDSPGAGANRRARFSAMRSSAVPLNPSPWNLDITQSGKICVANAGKLTLWRPQKDDAIKLTIKGAGTEQTIDWPAGTDTLAWPAALPVTGGSEYQLSQANSGDSARVTFVTLASAPADNIGTAQSLIANGCNNQLDVLVETAPSMD